MNHRRRMCTALVLILALLGTLCFGCGKKHEEKVTIKVGFMSVNTGPVAPAMTSINYAVENLARYINEEDPIPGVKLDLIRFDEQYDPSRDVPGYDWCRAKGADVILTPVPPTAELLKPFAERDKVPVFTWVATDSMIEPPGWVFCLGGYTPELVGILLGWVIEQWPNYPTKPKIGSYGWSETAEIAADKAVREYCQAHPDKSDYVTDVLIPMGAMFGSGDVRKLKDCDYIFTSGANAAVTGFLRDFRARGYKAKWLSVDAFPSVRGLAVDMCGWEALDGTLSLLPTRWWNETYPLIELAENLLHEYDPGKEEELIHAGIGYIGSFHGAYMFFDILRETVREVGAENFDNQALHDVAIKFTRVYEGYPEWGFSETKRWAMDGGAIYEWQANVGDLVRISDWLP